MKVFLETYGCQMNEYDSELVRSILRKAEYEFVAKESQADVVMLNTCAIRENAHRKIYGRVHEIRHGRDGKPVMIGILGCMATNLRQELFENRKLDIDFIAGPDSYKVLPDLIAQASGEGAKPFDLTLSEFETYSDIYPAREKGVNAWIAVMRGCNNFCTFCVVPYTRGRERSRSIENVLEEVKQLAKDGYKQVTLLGQNVNSYHYEGRDFADLMQAVADVEGIERIRFTSPHPKDFPDRFIDLMASNPKICKQIHIPLQAGNNRVLDMMNRTYTKEEFLALVEKMKAKIPNLSLSTDIIVGFPTEADAEFQDTLDVVKEVQFDFAFMFKYSERKGTIAHKKFPDDIPEAIKTERIVKLVEMQRDITTKKHQSLIGKTLKVLIELEATTKSADECQARTEGNHIVVLPKGDLRPGDIVDVEIIGATSSVLKAQAVSNASLA